MTKAMALEWGKCGINVNAICPGYVGTELNLEYFASEPGRQLLELSRACWRSAMAAG